MNISEVEMVCPNVGQANCSFVHKDGKAVIFDMGNEDSYGAVKRSLEENGITNLKVVISHLDDDHCQGLIKLLKEFSGQIKIDEIIIPERGDGTDLDKFNEIRKLVYQNEVILSVREEFKMNEEEFKDFQKSIDKRTKDKTNPLYQAFQPKDEKERLALKFLVYKSNNKTFETKDINDFKELFDNNEEMMYEYIKDYTKNICLSRNLEFKDMNFKTLKTGEEYIMEIYNFGRVRLIKPFTENFDKENFNSIVSFLEIEIPGKDYNTVICFPGDIEAKQEAMLVKMMDNETMKVAILVCPHHGSNTSSTKDFIKAISPKLVVIQALSGVFGHPHPGVLKNYEDWGINYVNQETNGMIKFKIHEFDYVFMMTEKLELELLRTGNESLKQLTDLNQKMGEFFCEKDDAENLFKFIKAKTFEEKFEFFEKEGFGDQYRILVYAYTASETILKNGGVEIGDNSFFKLAFKKGCFNIEDGIKFFSENKFFTAEDMEQEIQEEQHLFGR